LMLAIILCGLYWLAIGIFVIIGTYLAFNSNLKIFGWIRRNSFAYLPVGILAVFILAILLRVFVIEIFSIPSGSMENTLIEGDKILVSKLNYGPALPMSPLDVPWLNLIWYLQANASTNIDSIYWVYKRLNGYSYGKHGDVIVFLNPLRGKRNNFFIKRCTGIPGDTLQIINGDVFVNNRILPFTDQVKQRYRVKVNNWTSFQKLTDSLDIEAYGIFPGRTDESIELSLSRLQRKQLSGQNCVDSFYISIEDSDSIQWVYPKNTLFEWTTDNFGPLVIPRKGLTINLTHFSYLIYQRTIDMLEKQKIRKNNGLFYLNGQTVTTYTFQYNYYFMMAITVMIPTIRVTGDLSLNKTLSVKLYLYFFQMVRMDSDGTGYLSRYNK